MREEYYFVLSFFGAMFGYFFGGFDVIMQVFITVFLVDTASGMLKSYRDGTYKSKAFRNGVSSKLGYLLAIVLAVQLDKLIGDIGVLRHSLLFCFIANESTSIVENLGQMGVKFPKKVTNAIAVLREKSEEE